MKPEDIKEFRDTQRFVPFRLCLTDGKVYEIAHPELLMVTKSLIIIQKADKDPKKLPDAIWISPDHVIRIEALEPARR